MYIEQSPNTGWSGEPDSPDRAPESGEPLESMPVSRDPDIGSEDGDREDLAPESGGRADLSQLPTGITRWHSSGLGDEREMPAPAPKAGRGWLVKALGAAGLVVAVGALASALARRSRYTFTDKTVVVTGGSRGLGLLLARRLAAEGARLVLLARDADELQRASRELGEAGGNVLPIPCDITQRDQVESAIQQAAARFGGIDVLINNAGVIQVGPIEHMRIEDFEEAMKVHLWGPLYATMAVLPHLRQRGEGRIVNISSIGGKVAFPHLGPYATSKFALTGLSDALRAELRRENIYVTTVCPGLMRTGSPPNITTKGRHEAEYAWFAISDSLPLLSVNANRAAARILEACRRGAPRLVIGAQAKAVVMLNELMPGLSARMLAIANRLLPSPAPGGSPEERTGWESQSKWAPSRLTSLIYKAAERNNEVKAVDVEG